MKTSVTITIPATSANLGPGFDCLGLALSLYNEVTLTAVPTAVSHPDLHVTVSGLDAAKIPTDATNQVVAAANVLFERVGRRPPGLRVRQHNNIPVGSGLGSSSTAVLAGLFGANALLDAPYTRHDILQIAAGLEGHPDNVAPAIYGGLVLGVQTAGGVHVEQIPTPPLTVVVVKPDFHLLTTEARAALPAHVPRADAVFNAGRLALLVRALETADYPRLALAMEDRLHQPVRVPLIPGMAAAFEAARAAGAAGVALSGAGPSIIAFAPDGHAAIAAAMRAAFAAAGLHSRAWTLTVDTAGCQIATR